MKIFIYPLIAYHGQCRKYDLPFLSQTQASASSSDRFAEQRAGATARHRESWSSICEKGKKERKKERKDTVGEKDVLDRRERLLVVLRKTMYIGTVHYLLE